MGGVHACTRLYMVEDDWTAALVIKCDANGAVLKEKPEMFIALLV